MTLLVLGATGLLGSAIMAEAYRRGWEAVGCARRGAERHLDLEDGQALRALVGQIGPDVVLNAAALVNLATCEADPGLAYRINARPAALLAELSREFGFFHVHVSTDHFFLGDGDRAHAEDAPIRLINEYACSKYAAEAFALAGSQALVARTNIVGFRPPGSLHPPSFAEWATAQIEADAPMALFDDFYASSLDTPTCARALLDLAAMRCTGLVNVASSEVASKRAFIAAMADAMGRRLTQARPGSVRDVPDGIPRADSLGLDVAKAETLLGYPLPGLRGVIANLLRQRQALRSDAAPVSR